MTHPLAHLLSEESRWEEVQRLCEEAYGVSRKLAGALELLYFQQRASQFISDRIYRYIHELYPVSSPDGRYRFYVQYNPSRALRGVPDVLNPNPVHTIPFKGGIPCFCCLDNIHMQWPHERGFRYEIMDVPFVFLPNNSPVFDHHFTVVTEAHIAQYTDVKRATRLAAQLPGYWVVQNGADAGATNPYHFHFQCFLADYLPLKQQDGKQLFLEESLANAGVTVKQLDLPATVYRFRYPLSFAEGVAERISSCMNRMCSDDTIRFNMLVFCENDYFDFYLVLRQSTRRTDLYRSGQPGYAEVAGIISVIDDPGRDKWMTDGWALYYRLMNDIAVNKDVVERFEALLSTAG